MEKMMQGSLDRVKSLYGAPTASEGYFADLDGNIWKLKKVTEEWELWSGSHSDEFNGSLVNRLYSTGGV